MKNALHITDSLTKGKKKILLQNPDINLYVCGITPYDDAHIGHGRCYVTYDVLVRLVRFFNANITYVRNVTDINEKLENKAFTEYADREKFLFVAEHYYGIFKKNMAQLNCLDSDYTPKVTESIPEIIEFVRNLLFKGFAYEKEDGVYFRVERFSEYGRLSGRINQDKKETVSRLLDLHNKENMLDFVLWKKHSDKPHWASPWGYGSPGWHIECSAMIRKSFSVDTIDIHGGGIDLIFPHHENEKAQTESLTNKPLAHVWMHVAPVQVNNQKMSKSFGNSITLEQLFLKIDPMVLRFYFLMHNYNTPMEFIEEQLKSVEKNYAYIKEIFRKTSFIDEEFSDFHNRIIDDCYSFLCDDFNTAAVIGLFFKYKKDIEQNKKLHNKMKEIFQFILGLSLSDYASPDVVKEISLDIISLMKERDDARVKKDFVRADQLRNLLKEKGYEVNDKKS